MAGPSPATSLLMSCRKVRHRPVATGQYCVLQKHAQIELPMNIAITRAAEGLPRRAFTVDDISRMIEAGILGEDENFELIEGDIVVTAAKHVGRGRIKNARSSRLSDIIG
jgi:hypothetical protein